MKKCYLQNGVYKKKFTLWLYVSLKGLLCQQKYLNFLGYFKLEIRSF